jgi:hypothetical protein
MLTVSVPAALDTSGWEATADAVLVTLTAADFFTGASSSENVRALPG